MSGYIRREDRLFDPTTGALVGYIDANGNEQLGYPVSGAGISYGTLASTPGTTAGEKRTLSDGPDKGAQLVWSQPSGKTSYAWCWQIYPLAAYP